MKKHEEAVQIIDNAMNKIEDKLKWLLKDTKNAPEEDMLLWELHQGTDRALYSFYELKDCIESMKNNF